ncbi:MAG: CinA family nicotinamide mononucleotide deamidase-related protein [Actinobacteria bacterium]|nr:CinA family nicotinamide mononucleotide deamidase-related protein [Actinomycetota bacterium]
MKSCSLISVGDELLDGRVENSNADLLAERMRALGLQVALRVEVGDDLQAIERIFSAAMDLSDLVLVTGGLGPTDDDITREAVAAALGARLVRDGEIEGRLRAFFAALGREMSPSNARQADLIEGAVCITPRLGTAPGQWIERGGKIAVLLPGVPREMEDMVEGDVIPRLRGALELEEVHVAALLVAARPESEVGELLGKALAGTEGVRVSYRTTTGRIEVKLSSRDEETLSQALARAREALEGWVVAENGMTLEESLGRELEARGLTLAVAESCTGGLVAEMITRAAGSSRYFRGGVVAYDYEAKQNLLGVSPSLLEEKGAVNEEVAEAMAAGARRLLAADMGLSVSGVAGPGSGGEREPVGTVVFGLADERGGWGYRYRLPGNREMVRQYAANIALTLALFHLRGVEVADGR